MAADENSWRTTTFRQSVVQKLDEAIRNSGMPYPKSGVDMEKHVFQKAKSKEDYLGFVARLILHVRETSSKKAPGMNTGCGQGQNMQDPINALQNLTRQGGGNQLMGLVPPQSQPTATNMLQTLNQRPLLQQKLQPGLPMGPMPGQINQMGQMNNSMGGPMSNPMVNQMGPMGVPMGGQMNNQMGGPMGGMSGPNQMGGSMGTPLSNQVGGQMVGSMGGQMGHMQQRKVPVGNEGSMMLSGQGPGYGGPRPVAPNNLFRQSPTPPNSAQSPASAAVLQSNQMVNSPSLAPSPNTPQMVQKSGSIRSVGMAPSPSSSLNTPGQPVASPCSIQEEQIYREKVRQLSKYIEPLRKMIARMGNDDVEKNLGKMSTLLDILSNPSKRMPLETLIKCEIVLEKLDFKRGETGSTGLKEQHPLLEAVSNHLSSPLLNHTLQRTFGPSLDALFGSDIKMLPPLPKKRKLEEPQDDIPEVLQGEIARLDQRFKVSLDRTQQTGSRSIQLLCWLDDRHLPCVPPVFLSIPEDYPASPPKCHLSPHEYSATKFLSAIQSALHSRISKLPGRYSVSQLLDTWEMSVRQACAPAQNPIPSF